MSDGGEDKESPLPNIKESPIKGDDVDDDNSSGKDLNKEIEEMRARVELQLKSLMQGADFVQIRQQVADLRATTPIEEAQPVNAPQGNDNNNSITPLDRGSSFNSSSSLTDLHESISKKRNRLEQLLNETKQDQDQDQDKTTYKEDEKILDPYGDKGAYTGEVDSKIKPHGLGTMHYNDGRTYTGSWSRGQWHGQGTASFVNGDKFDGNYDLDRRHGFGVYSWSDGRIYEGEFYHDRRQGCGEYRWPDGALYRGEFASGHRQGEGTYTFSDGSIYTGEWLKGRYHGVGQCVWKDGRSYKGEWKEGKAHGYGVEKRGDGSTRHEGMWNNDVPIRKSA
mmetsp:Transcript_16719/g.25452  ORF Transcript_16719/g.25452 Transcript_16719/m.25452 type:complete len:336 (-) Transcript_16719:94-1101(-)